MASISLHVTSFSSESRLYRTFLQKQDSKSPQHLITLLLLTTTFVFEDGVFFSV
jgi:hypothetical protein